MLKALEPGNQVALGQIVSTPILNLAALTAGLNQHFVIEEI
jgi:hypothetical protein